METFVNAGVHADKLLPPLTLRRWVKTIAVLIMVSFLGLLICLQYGTERIPFSQMLRLLAGSEALGSTALSPGVILWEVRLPRLILAFLVGSSLATVGVALQALLRNPLADPYILGISSGAALGAALAVQLGVSWAFAGFSAVHLFAFIGAAVTIIGIYHIASADGRIPVQTLLLAGVIFFTSALLTGAVVAVSGLIGFVGMIVPHAVRMILGPDHRLLLPASALVGGTFLGIADTIARSLLAPSELPVGVITALCGGPFFIYLLITRRKSHMA